VDLQTARPKVPGGPHVLVEPRLEVQNRCITVIGTVAYVAHEDDGDIYVDLRLPPSEAHPLNNANVADQSGQLVTEIATRPPSSCLRRGLRHVQLDLATSGNRGIYISG